MKANRKLLHEILNEATDPMRQEVFEASLRELRRRRQIVRIQRRLPLAIAAVLVLSAYLFFGAVAHHGRKEARSEPKPSQANPGLAYAHIEIVTNHWPSMAVVESGQYQSLIVDNSTVQHLLQIIDDVQLLALFPDKPVGLMAGAHGIVQLVFLDPRDQILVH